MKLWERTGDFGDLNRGVEITDHVVYIATLFQEAEPALEGYASDYIECVPLAPNGQVYRLTLKVAHSINEDLSTFVSIGLIIFHVRHREQLRNWSFQGFVVHRIASRKHTIHRLILVEWRKYRIKV